MTAFLVGLMCRWHRSAETEWPRVAHQTAGREELEDRTSRMRAWLFGCRAFHFLDGLYGCNVHVSRSGFESASEGSRRPHPKGVFGLAAETEGAVASSS